LTGKANKFGFLAEVRQKMNEEVAIEPDTIVEDAIEARTVERPSLVPPSTVEPFQPDATNASTVEPSAIEQVSIEPGSFTRIPNGILDRVLPTLNPYDQLILLRLYRLSRGFGKEECTVGYESLGKACNMSGRQAQISTDRLALAGWIERVGVRQGGKSRHSRGSVYRVNLPAASTKAPPAIAQSSIAPPSANKDKELNERLKREARTRDFSDCPDCQGKGFYWPEGYERGVAKCKHKRLS
jgi:hypothetical protein